MNLQDDRTNSAPTESAGEATESLWSSAEATETVPNDAGDDDLVEKLAVQLDQWLQANGCQLVTSTLAPAVPISTHIANNIATQTATRNF